MWYSDFTEFGRTMKLFRLIKICINKAYNKIHMPKNQCRVVAMQNGVKQGDASSSLLFSFDLLYAIRKVEENQKDWD
jgi:hypothetical protein